MRAKFDVVNVAESKNDQQETTIEHIKMMAVSSKPFDKDGNSEDNSFARWTPSGDLVISITNPSLFGKIKIGQSFYLSFDLAN